MARLTIRGEAGSATSALRALQAAIEAANNSNQDLINRTKSLRDHYRRAAAAAGALTREQTEAAAQAQGMARAHKEVQASAQVAAGSIDAQSQAASRLRSTQLQVARATRVAASASERQARAAERAARAGRGGAAVVGGGGSAGVPGRAQVGRFERLMNGAATRVGRFTSRTFSRVISGTAGFFTGALANVIGGAGDLIRGVFRSAFRFATRALQVGLIAAITAAAAVGGATLRRAIAEQPLQEGFVQLLEARGIDDSVAALEELRSSARGTVSDLNLVRNANAALQLGAAENTEQLGFLIEAGRRLGKVLGRDANEGFNDLAIGIGRQSRLILDNLGLIVKVEDANRAYAESVGATVRELGESERRLAFQEAAYEAIRQKLRELGPEQELTVDQIGRLRANLGNLASDIGARALPSIDELVSKWAEFVGGIDPDEVQDLIDRSLDAIRSAGSSAADLLFGSTPGGTRAAFSGVESALREALTNPSRSAFEVLGVRVRAFAEVARIRLESIWDTLPQRANVAFVKAADFFTRAFFEAFNRLFDGLESLFGVDGLSEFFGIRDFRRTLAEAASDANNALRRRFLGTDTAELTLQNSRESADLNIQSTLRDADREVASLMRQAAEETAEAASSSASAARAAQSAAEGLDAATGQPGAQGGGGQSRLQQEAAAEREAREEARAAAAEEAKAKKAEKERIEAAERARRAEIRAMEANQRAIEGEVRAREQEISSLEKASRNLDSALAGDDAPFESVASAIDFVADELRRFGPELRDVADTISGIDAEIAASVAQLSADLDDASRQFAEDVRNRSRQFLLGGGVEGETTRVRALRRQAQREQRRRNRDIFQRELGAPSLSSFGGNLGGFGAQNVGRAGGVLDNIPAGLESALSQIINSDGSTLILDLETQIAQIVAEANEEQTALNAARADAIEEQRRVLEDQRDVFRRALELQELAVQILKETKAEQASDRGRIADIERQLEEVRRLARKNV